ncbi:Holliday junction resolvase RuvX [bacterium]|jgi:putative Holliday junction resolvase|nr:Holliday junction resolvase RuvX [bacterium]MBT3850351.1 Holliday junction resolvase RuvX [bacterium]MBT4634549.1 Holliday junction resolvase RuvX [bacterium]MDG2445750.1 Holliday junction resolvase RuvX [Thermodesulfobacteriota bacterium]|tara:strand:+ start:785 stop:1189 length:405 start_codon:yes stop_codon:yes gene_type:complete
MAILAIDFGLKRIGVAASDELGIASHPIKLIHNKGDNSYVHEIVSIIEERNPDLILIGLPVKDDGRLKIQDDIEDFHKKLVNLTNKKVEFWNENFTSKEADEILIKMNISRKKRKNFQDMLAACLIIDSYLRSL